MKYSYSDIEVERSLKFLSPRMAAWLDEHTPNEERLRGNRPLFVNPDGRTAPLGRYNAQALRKGWSRAAKPIGLEHVRMYEVTKHSTLTEGRRRGIPLDQLQRAAGHKDIRSTEVYAEMGDAMATKVLRHARNPRKKD